MKYFFSIIALCLFFLLTNSTLSQNKPLSQIIKTTIPENPIVGIKNDDNELYLIKKKVSGYDLENRTSNQLNKQNYELNSFNMIIEGGSEPYDVHTVLTERTGSTAGTIWIVAVIKSIPSGSDKLGIYKLEQNNWVLKTYIYTFRVLGSSMDAEIIERNNGNKFLWIVCESRQTPGAKKEVSVAAIDLQTLTQGTLFTLDWDNAWPSNEYYNPRIATDNGADPGYPWIFIVVSLDSIMTNGNHVNAQKFAFVDNPWEVTNLNVHYRQEPLPVFWPVGGTNEIHYLYSDIAYINQQSGQGKLIFTYSNVPDDTKIWLSSCSIDGTNAQFVGTIEYSGNSRIRNSAIASAGGLNQEQLMVVFEENWLNSGDWDLITARSNDGGLTWALSYIDNSTAADKNPILGTLVSRIGATDEYYVSYTIDTPVDSVMCVKSNNGITNYWDPDVRMNNENTSIYIYSAAGFTNAPGERVIAWARELFPGYYELISGFWPNLPSAVEDELEINPNVYHLFQNYPNPFNPSTKISWQSPVGSHQTLKVYDLLGNKVATLVDEYKSAGNYEVEFDASHLSSGIYFYRLSVVPMAQRDLVIMEGQAGSFVETKKMILVK